MKYIDTIKYLIFTIGMIVNINIYAQGDALSIEQKCDPSKLDLTIDGGYPPYEVEWQALVNGTWQTVSGWPKTNLSGSDGQEDFTSTLNYEEYKVIVHDNLCGFVEKEIVVDPCKCIKVELFQLGNVDECWHPNGQMNNGFISLEITGTTDYSVEWSNGDSGYSISKLKTGYYVATITSGACEIVKGYTICCCEVITEELPGSPVILCNQDGNLEITDSQVYSPTTSTSFDGSITLQVNGGRFYTWYFNGDVIARTKNINGLGPGTYTVLIQDGCGGRLLKDFTLVDCTSKNITVNGSVTNTCQGYKVGAISVSVSGGTPPIKYKWSNGATSATISGLAPGQYCVTVSDDEGCFKEKCFNVGLNEAQTIRTGCTFTTYCNGNPVNQYDIGSFSQVNSSDCRYVDYFCSDGYFLYSDPVGTYLQKGNNCTIYEKCISTNETYFTHNGEFITGSVGPAIDNSGCYLCHSYSYCYYPTLRTTTDFNQQFNGLIIENPNIDCIGDEKEDGRYDCYVTIYCNGSWVAEGCDDYCDLDRCYLTLEKPVINDLDLPINKNIAHKLSQIDLSNNEEDKFSLWPIPSNDLIQIVNKQKGDIKPKEIKIFTITGQLVKSLDPVFIDDNAIEINIENFHSGPYKVLIFESGKLIFNKTIIKL